MTGRGQSFGPSDGCENLCREGDRLGDLATGSTGCLDSAASVAWLLPLRSREGGCRRAAASACTAACTPSVTRISRWRGAVSLPFWLRDRLALSHYSAGWLLGLISTRPVPVHVTTPLPRRRRGAVRIHHSRTSSMRTAPWSRDSGHLCRSNRARSRRGVRFRSLRRVIRALGGAEGLRPRATSAPSSLAIAVTAVPAARAALAIYEPPGSPARNSSGIRWRWPSGWGCRSGHRTSTSLVTSSTSTGRIFALRSNSTSTRPTAPEPFEEDRRATRT